jgi:hypothetical protein
LIFEIRNLKLPSLRLGASAVILLLILCIGCVQEGGRLPPVVVSSAQPPQAAPPPAPPQLETLAGQLMNYRVRYGNLPNDLRSLVDAKLMTQAEYEALPDYAYSPLGLGVLRDKRLLLVVDSAIRTPNRAWCIVREPSDSRTSVVYQTILVPMSQLDAAANAVASPKQ